MVPLTSHFLAFQAEQTDSKHFLSNTTTRALATNQWHIWLQKLIATIKAATNEWFGAWKRRPQRC